MQRPFGVTILAIVALLIGLWGIIKGLALLGIGGAVAVMAGAAHPVAGFVVLGLTAAFGVTALVVAAFYLAFTFGALRLRPWAWGLGVWTAGLALAWALLATLARATHRGRLGEIIVNAAILFYLNLPEVRAAFGRA
jgi:hypothetical protein